MAANRRQVMAFERLSKKYGAFTAVRDLDLAIEQGEVFGFLGPNGAGKTHDDSYDDGHLGADVPRIDQVADRAWLAALAVAAAPVFEEFISRGLVFGGLRRSFGLAAATLASAAIFAIVHPPMSVIPVFLMGVCAALIYERTKVLAAPMTVHAVYNAAVLGFQWNMMQ